MIDPVDGTREYGEGRSDWAVHVALVMDGSPTAARCPYQRSGLCSRVIHHRLHLQQRNA
ncbi:MAG: inositol monophosphatase family protein [Microthrixaceae bacterium]